MPVAPEHAVAQAADIPGSDHFADWETPAGRVDAATNARYTSPDFTYRGYAEPHWRGQACHLISENAPEECVCVVVMACGCRASVPWWTLEPRTDSRA